MARLYTQVPYLRSASFKTRTLAHVHDTHSSRVQGVCIMYHVMYHRRLEQPTTPTFSFLTCTLHLVLSHPPTLSGNSPQAQLAEGGADPGRELRAAALDREGAGAGHRLRRGEVPQHRGVLGRCRRYGYRDDHDHGRHVHKRMQVSRQDELNKIKPPVFAFHCYNTSTCIVVFAWFLAS